MSDETPRRGYTAVAIVLLFTPPVFAQPITAKSHADPAAVSLWQYVTVTLTLEGPAPLRVELPKELLAPESAKGWRIKPLGPATVEKTGTREAWTHRYRLDPFDVPLNAETTIAFAPVRVNGTTQTWPPVRVTVKTVWTNPDAVKPEAAHPVTGIEELPPKPPPDPAEVGWWLLGGAGTVFLVVLVVGQIRRLRAKPPPLPPPEGALAALDAADRALTGRALADRVADALRIYVEAQHQLPAPRLTTSELVRDAEGANWPAESVAELRALLDRCDRAKFAGAEPDADEGHDLVARAKRWVGGK